MIRNKTWAAVGAAAVLAPSVLIAAPAEAASSRCTSSDGITTCTFIDTKTTQGWKTGFSDAVENRRSYSISANCYQSKSTQIKFSITVSMSVSASAWVFAKIDASVSGTAERATTVTHGSSATFKVPARSTVHCKHGTYTAVVKGHTTITVRGKRISTKYWTATAPKQQKWIIS